MARPCAGLRPGWSWASARQAGAGLRPDWSWASARQACAKVAELADAPDLGSGSRKAMGVRLPPFALKPANYADSDGLHRKITRDSDGLRKEELSADYADYTDSWFYAEGASVDVFEKMLLSTASEFWVVLKLRR